MATKRDHCLGADPASPETLGRLPEQPPRKLGTSCATNPPSLGYGRGTFGSGSYGV